MITAADNNAIVERLNAIDAVALGVMQDDVNHGSFINCGYLHKELREIVSLIECLPVEHGQDNAVAAFQRLPDGLAKALNYGSPMAAEDWDRLAQIWNTRMAHQQDHALTAATE